MKRTSGGGLLLLRRNTPLSRRAVAYVWSAVLSQAKSEGDRLVCANVFDLCWSLRLLARMECAALCSYLVLQSQNRLLATSGLQSAGFDRCVISLFASRPWQKTSLYCSSSGVADVGIACAISKPGSTRRHLQLCHAVILSANKAGRYSSPFASTAQAVRANLLARAIAATL